jgi:glutamate-1-semialdehyde 2,1-aminomutase
MKTSRSAELYAEALRLFPGGVNSPVRAFRSVGGTPLFISSGKGSQITDVDGNKFIDYCCSWGPLILGHCPPKVIAAATDAMAGGTSFGAPTEAENKLANLIISNHPFIEKLRFVSSGTEAVMSAIRLARGYTGRPKILKFEGCYHGHADSMLVKAGSGLVTFGNPNSAGVPESISNETITVSLNDRHAVEEAFKQYGSSLAAVIIEPVPANNGLLLQTETFLRFLRDICSAHKTLLIFDEVISGFRLSFAGAAGLFDIAADIFTFGKIIGGGFPVGAYGASAEIMSRVSPEGSVYQAGTLSGNPVAMSAGLAQLSECLSKDFYSTLEKKTVKLANGIKSVSSFRKLKVFYIGSIFWIAFTDKEEIRSADDIDPASMQHFKTLYHALLSNGVYLGPSGYEVGFMSAAHSDEDIDHTIQAFEKSISKLSE